MKPLTLILLILIEALTRGFNYRGYTSPKTWKGMNLYKWLDHLFMGLLIACFFMYSYLYGQSIRTFNPWWVLGHDVLVYVLMRFVMFNYVHNLAAGLPLKHIGKVSWVDRLLGLVSMGNLAYYLALQVVALLAVIQIIFKVVKI